MGATTFYGGRKKKESQVTAAKTRVLTQEAKTVEMTTDLTFKTTLEPVEEAVVSGKTGGKVVRILFENGKAVAAGDPMVILDDTDVRNQLAAAGVTRDKAKVNLEVTQRNYDRVKALHEQGAIAQSDFEESGAALNIAKADLDTAVINVQVLEDTLANTVVRAPMSGTADDKNIRLGQFISAGMALATAKNNTSVNAVIQVDQKDLKYIKIGQKARIKLPENTARTFEWQVTAVGVSANPVSRVFTCKIKTNNDDGALSPGIFAQVEIPAGQKREALVVPLKALSGEEGSYYVYVAENGMAKKRNITVGEISDEAAEAKAGVEKGDQIIVTNLNTLQDGDEITVAEQEE